MSGAPFVDAERAAQLKSLPVFESLAAPPAERLVSLAAPRCLEIAAYL
jgi:hypothetical protein